MNVQLCDGCGRSFDTDEPDAHCTDAEVCGGGDGPGFFLCAKCGNAGGLGVEARRTLYTEQRAKNDAAKARAERLRQLQALVEQRAETIDEDTSLVIDVIGRQGVAWLAMMVASACSVEDERSFEERGESVGWDALERDAVALSRAVERVECPELDDLRAALAIEPESSVCGVDCDDDCAHRRALG